MCGMLDTVLKYCTEVMYVSKSYLVMSIFPLVTGT